MISVAICTYNRAEQLKKTLEGFAQHKHWLMKNHVELIVVDNNSTDHTVNVVKQFQSDLGVSMVREAQQGLAHARNRAVRTATNDMVAFFDDDVTVTEIALKEYMTAVKRYPDYDFFGGKIKVDWHGQRPGWLRKDNTPLLEGLIGHYDLGREDEDYAIDSLLPYGANFLIRKQLFNLLSGFDGELGVKGAGIGRGEETDFFRRALRNGRRGKYLSKATVFHRFQVERLNARYLYRYGMAKGEVIRQQPGEEVLNAKNDKHDWQFEWSCYLLKAAWQLAKGRRDRFYQCVINMGIVRGISNGH